MKTRREFISGASKGLLGLEGTALAAAAHVEVLLD